MKTCDFCGVEDLTWMKNPDISNVSKWLLIDSDGNQHYCEAEAVKKQREKKAKEKQENQELARKYKEQSGYL